MEYFFNPFKKHYQVGRISFIMVNRDWNKSHSYKTIISRLLANFFFLHIKKKGGEIEYFSILARFGLCHLINLHVYTPCDPNSRICPHKNRSICLTSQSLVSKTRNWNQLLQPLSVISKHSLASLLFLHRLLTSSWIPFFPFCPRIYSKIIQCLSESLLRRLQRRLVSDFFFSFSVLCLISYICSFWNQRSTWILTWNVSPLWVWLITDFSVWNFWSSLF